MPDNDTLLAPRGVVILGGAHGSLALARSMGRAGVPVRYVSNDSPLTGWSRHIGRMERWPGPEEPQSVAFLLDFARRNGLEGALLVPASDPEVKFVSQSASELSAVFRIMLPEWERLRWLCDKPLLYRRAAELGLSFPQTYRLSSLEEGLALEPVFPVILKPNMGGGNGPLAKAKVLRADDRAAFTQAFRAAVEEMGAENVVVQQFIPGGGECQFSYAALWCDGRPVAEFTARRSRQYPVDFGLTSTFVETVEVPGVTEASRTLLESVGYSGLVEIEYKRDPRSGVLNVLDVNPRPWAWLALAPAAGMDLGLLMWEAANGRLPSSPPRARLSASWMYLARDAVASAILIGRGRLGLSAYLASLPRIRAWAAFSWSDPAPGLLDLPLTAFRVVTRRVLNLSK